MRGRPPSDRPVSPPLQENSIRVCDYGDMAYPEALAALEAMVAERSNQRVPDSLMLLEHPPTYTLGLRARPEHLLVPETELKKQNINVFQVDRGGDITFHGPGQLVGYPVLDLKARQLDIRQYVHRLERFIIRSLADFGVSAHRADGFPGVWVDHQKIAAIGIKINADRCLFPWICDQCEYGSAVF